MTEQLEIHALGGLRVARDGVPIINLGSRQAEALLLYLAHSRHPQPREVLAALFWEERTSHQALANLRWLVARLKQRLPDFLLVAPTYLSINPRLTYYLDATDFEECLQQARAGHPRGDSLAPHAVKLLEQAMSLYGGPFLQGFFARTGMGFEEWALHEQERLHHLATLALGDLVDYYSERGEYQAGIQRATWLLQLDPLHEKTHRALIEMLASGGQRSAALERYDAYRRLFYSELGYISGDELNSLYNKITSSGNERDRARLERGVIVQSRPEHLPLSLTPFVGRERELSEILRFLGDPDCRLLTLVGQGGAGKTRLAVKAAQASQGFGGGIFFVSLTSVSNPEFIVSAIANALQITLSGARSLLDQLIDWLQDKQALLVLDNFEHLLDGTGLLPDLLVRAPGVKLLVTCRQPLDLAAEQVYDIGGLEVPPDYAPTDSDVAKLESYSAVHLFVQRARRVLSRFSLSAGEATSVVQICRVLDGLPLAIELAAIWVRERTPEDVLKLLSHDIDFLSTSRADVPARHRSLRAVFDQSWLLLTEAERHVISCTAVFRGGFSEEGALQVAGADRDILMGLVERSLIRQTPGGRFNIHEMLRQYTAARLEAYPGETEKVQAQHLIFFARLVEEAFPELVGPQQLVWLGRLEQEQDNIRAALTRALVHHDALVALRMTRALQRFWYFRGYLREGLGWLESALALPESQIDLTGGTPVPEREREVALARAKSTNAAGVLCQDMGELAKAEVFVSESVALFRALNETKLLASPLNNLGLLARDAGDLPRAHSLLEESLALFREQGDRQSTAVLLNNLGKVVLWIGDNERARSLLEESRDLFREQGDMRGVSLAEVNLAQVARNEHDYPRALAAYKESLRRYTEIGDKRGQAECLEGIGEVATLAARSRGAYGSLVWKRIATILGGAAALRAASGARLSEVDHGHLVEALRVAQARLDETLWIAAWSEGQAPGQEPAIACALEMN